MILTILFVAITTFVPVIANHFSGKRITVFSSVQSNLKPLLMSSIVIQLLLIFKEAKYNMSFKNPLLIFLCLFLLFQTILLYYQMKHIKDGVYQKGVIIYGIFYEYGIITGYRLQKNNSRLVLEIKIGNKNRKVYVEEQYIMYIRDFFYSSKIYEIDV